MKKVFLILGLSFSMFFISCSGPEDKLADHIDDIAEIMSENEKAPENLADEMVEYFDSNFGKILAVFGEALTELQDLGPEDREKRMAEMAIVVYEAIERNEDVFESFSETYSYEYGYTDEDCYQKELKECERRQKYSEYYENCYDEAYKYCCIEGEMSDELEDFIDALEDKYDGPLFDMMTLLEELYDVGLKKPSRKFARSVISIVNILEAVTRNSDDGIECNERCRDKMRDFENSWEEVFDDVHRSMNR